MSKLKYPAFRPDNVDEFFVLSMVNHQEVGKGRFILCESKMSTVILSGLNYGDSLGSKRLYPGPYCELQEVVLVDSRDGILYVLG